MWLQIESVQTPAHNHTEPLYQSPVLWPPLQDWIFSNAFYISHLFPLQTCCFHLDSGWFFLQEREGLSSTSCWLWQVLSEGFRTLFIGFYLRIKDAEWTHENWPTWEDKLSSPLQSTHAENLTREALVCFHSCCNIVGSESVCDIEGIHCQL